MLATAIWISTLIPIRQPGEGAIETSMLMPAIEMNTASSYEQATIWTEISKFNMSATRSSGTYTQFNQALQNLKTLLTKAAETGRLGNPVGGNSFARLFTGALVDYCLAEVPLYRKHWI